MIFNNKEMNYNLHQKCGIIFDFILKTSMARKSFDNIICVINALKDNLDNNHYYNNKKIFIIIILTLLMQKMEIIIKNN